MIKTLDEKIMIETFIEVAYQFLFKLSKGISFNSKHVEAKLLDTQLDINSTVGFFRSKLLQSAHEKAYRTHRFFHKLF